jgi:chromosome segregation ATPase
MDFNQMAAKVAWLDEERRKDKAEIAALQQRLLGTENEAREMARHVQELQSELAAAQAQLAKLPRFDDALDKLRREITVLIEDQDERRRAAEREAEKLRRVELEAQAKALADFKRELSVIPRLAEELPLRKAEEQRLNAILGTISHQVAQVDERVDERIRDVSYLEESRRQDARKLTELQVELSELRKRIEARLPKVEVLEEQIVRTHARLTELVALEADRKQDHSKFIEQYAMLSRERDRRMDGWTESMGEIQRRVEGYARRIEAFGELQQVANAALSELDGLRRRLEQRQNEVAEMQRLGEERLKQHWLEFLAETDKRWKHTQIANDERWRDHERHHAGIPERFDELAAAGDFLRAELTRLWHVEEAHAQTITILARQWLEDLAEQNERVRATANNAP